MSEVKMPGPARRKKAQVATKEALAAQMKRWTRDEMVCRTYQHRWDAYTVEPEGKNLLSTLFCARCESYKYELIDGSSGHVLKRSRDYPPGYLTVGLGRIQGPRRDELRLETAKRFLKGPSKRHLNAVEDAG